MFNKLIEIWKTREAIKETKANPILGAVLVHLRDVFNDKSKGLGKYWSEDGKARLTNQILTDIQEALSQPNPVQATRMRILALMLETAKFQVLVIPPSPESDSTGIRDYEGVTGELKASIPELVKEDDELEEFFYGLDETPTTPSDMWDVVLRRYWVLHLYMNTYNLVRIALDDWHKEEKKDWFLPCYISMCIWQEDQYRKKLGMPSAISGDHPDWKALMHSTWKNRLEEGDKEVRLAWEKSWTDVFNEPSPYSKIIA